MATGFMAGSIVSKMMMDTKGWDSSIKAVRKDEGGLSSMSGRLSPQFAKIGAAMTIAGGLIIGALSKMTNKFIETGDWIDKMSKRTGVSAEALSELAHVAQIGGASLDNVEKGIKKMSKSIADAGDGLETYQRAFRKIGINHEELAKLSPEKQFLAISEAIAGVEAPYQRAAAAQDIFGRAGTTLLPMMSDGVEAFQEIRKEAHELGIVYDTELAASAAKLQDEKTRLNSSLQGLSNTLIISLVPAITDFTTKMTDVVKKVIVWGKENPVLISTIMKIVGGMGVLLVTLGPIVVILPKIIGLVIGVAKAFMFLTLNPVGLLITALAALTIGFLKVKDAQKKAEESSKNLAEVWGKFEDKLKGIATEAGLTSKQFEDLKKKYNGNINVMALAIKKGQEGIDLQNAMNKVGKERVEQQEKEKESNEFTLDSIKELTTGYEEVKEKAKDWTDFIKDMGIKTVKEKGDRTKELEGFVADLTVAYKAGKISLEDYRLATEAAKKEMMDLGTEIVDTVIPQARNLIDVLAGAPAELNKEGIVGFPGAIAIKAKEGATKVKTIWSEMTDGLKTKWGTMWGDFIKGGLSLKSFGEAFKTFTDNLLTQFSDMVGQMIAKWSIGLLEGMIKKTGPALADVVGGMKDVTTGATDIIKGFSPGGMIATGIGAAVGTFLGGLLGPKGPSARSTDLIKDNTWNTNQNVINLHDAMVAQLHEIKVTGWNLYEIFKNLPSWVDIGQNLMRVQNDILKETQMIIYGGIKHLEKIAGSVAAPPSTAGTQKAGQSQSGSTGINIGRIESSVNLYGNIISDRDYARKHMLPEILHALEQRTEKKRLQAILGIA